MEHLSLLLGGEREADGAVERHLRDAAILVEGQWVPASRGTGQP